MRIVIIGGGNMGGAILLALSKKKGFHQKDILLIEKDEEKRIHLSKKTGCKSQEEINQSICKYDLLLLAVKPKVSNSVMKLISKWILPQQLIISVMAGISLNHIYKVLKHKKIVRVMPNLPTLISEGMSIFFSSESVEKNELKWIKTIFSCCGTCIEAKDEDTIDAATAISGSGPGYIFYFAEQMTASAKSLGFSENEAKLLVQKTFLGSILLWQKMDLSPKILREQVSSPGGTTMAALDYFKSKNVGTSINDGIQKAYKRAKDLSS